MTARCSPGGLADALEALPVRVAALEVKLARVAVADYPGGSRPSSVVCLSGEGHTGFGENVAFAAEEHPRFAVRAAEWLARVGDGHAPAFTNRVAGALATLQELSLTPYERAALEAAIIDLAMRQSAASFRDLAGIAAAELRFVRSFAASADPSEPIRQWRGRGYTGDFKLDVDAAWDPETCERLSHQSGIAILDFKGRGDTASAQRLAALFPGAILEDPPAATVHRRVSRDVVLGDVAAVAQALARGEAVNLKAPRMGGPLAVLRALALALARRGRALPRDSADPPGELTAAVYPFDMAYLGGMFEVGVGRGQARQLAALYCGDAPNDLALNLETTPVTRGSPVTSSPMESPPAIVRLDQPGFGAIFAD